MPGGRNVESQMTAEQEAAGQENEKKKKKEEEEQHDETAGVKVLDLPSFCFRPCLPWKSLLLKNKKIVD